MAAAPWTDSSALMEDAGSALLGASNASSSLSDNASLVYPSDDYEAWVTNNVLNGIRNMFFMYKNPSTAVLIALYSVTFLVGCVGNLLVIYVYARCRSMRTVTNTFLVNLSVADLMVVCICMPFGVAMEIYQNWVYGDTLCKLVHFSQGLSVSASILTLTVISAERFYAIRHPLRARAFMSRARIRRIVCAIWVCASLTVVPSAIARREAVVERILGVTISSCVELWSIGPAFKQVYNFALLAALYIAPVLFICVGYLRIAASLWSAGGAQLHASVDAAASECARTHLAGRRKVARMLFVMAVLFAVSWLPLHALGILLDFLDPELLAAHGILLRRLHSYALWLGHANSCINPVCYCIMSRSFQGAVRTELGRVCRFLRPRQRRAAGTAATFATQLSMSGTVTATNHASGRHYGLCTRLLHGKHARSTPDLLLQHVTRMNARRQSTQCI